MQIYYNEHFKKNDKIREKKIEQKRKKGLEELNKKLLENTKEELKRWRMEKQHIEKRLPWIDLRIRELEEYLNQNPNFVVSS